MKKLLHKSYVWLAALVAMFAMSTSAWADSVNFSFTYSVNPSTHTKSNIQIQFGTGWNANYYGAYATSNGAQVTISCDNAHAITGVNIETDTSVTSSGKGAYSASEPGTVTGNTQSYNWTSSEGVNSVTFSANTIAYTIIAAYITVTYESVSTDRTPTDPAFAPTTVTTVKDGAVYNLVAVTIQGYKYNWNVSDNRAVLSTSGEPTKYIAEVNDEGKVAFKTFDGQYLRIIQPEPKDWLQEYSLTGVTNENDFDEGYNLFEVAEHPSKQGCVSIHGNRGKQNGAYYPSYFCIGTTGNFGGNSTEIYDYSWSTAFELREYSAAPTKAIGQNGSVFFGTYYTNHAWEIPEGYKAYIATAVDGEGAISLTEVTGNVVGANTGVLLKGPQSDNLEITYSFEEGFTSSENLFCGSVEDFDNIHEDGYKYYVLTYNTSGEELGFYYQYGSGDGSKVNNAAHKAYLRVPVSASPSNALSFRFDDTLTGIEEVVTAQTASEAVFNLKGQRVVAPAKGSIYMKNGRKFIAK